MIKMVSLILLAAVTSKTLANDAQSNEALLNEAMVFAVKPNKKMNVLFIGADDLRMNIGAYGDKTAITPNIDALASQGVIFTKAYVQFASCNASRASMLTGMYPDSINVYKLNTHFRKTAPDVITLPQHFKNNGYHSESIGKVYHNYANIRDPKSWSVPARLDQESHFDDYVLAASMVKGNKKGRATESAEYSGNKYVDDHITSDAVQTIKRLKNSNKPFFLAVGFMKPHAPYNAPKKYWDLYERVELQSLGSESKPNNISNLNWFNFKEIRSLTDLPKKGVFTKDTAQRLRHGYYAATSYVDDNVGQLIQALKDNNLYDNTIIVFWSDHGYHLGENGHWTKATVRELDTRVPLIFRIPGQKPVVSDAITEYIDIYPTLATLANLPAPANLDGRSFSHVFSDSAAKHKTHALSQSSRPWSSNKPIKHMGYTIRTDSYRYTRWVAIKGNITVSEELYHTTSDLLERKNLIKSSSLQLLQKMRGLLDKSLDQSLTKSTGI
ncbi:sulfatase [Colwellia sp. 12G3]|uniref:sulfatase n=1 Tax=Colwellia sp. 12G3 TaxID=2058299 RepID=UPI000C334117|nr:sulfatase [Colwellia sp. 12G3]PKI16660.1 iduronate-2-sulfatase [Colwellia sp. 12G3]